MLDILFAANKARKAIGSISVKRAQAALRNEVILRNGMAYAFEIGQGAPLRDQVVTSPRNPFLDPNWRDNVIPGSEL